MAERLARTEEWIEGHEQRCEDRQRAMGREIREVKAGQASLGSDIRGLIKGAWAVALGLLVWALVQVYDGLKPEPPSPAAVAIAASH